MAEKMCFSILKKPAIILREYQQGEFAQANKDMLMKLRSALNFIDPYNYRGISRASDNNKIFSTLEKAKKALLKCVPKENYEIVVLSKEPYESKSIFVGYDLGYWGSENYSLICDTAIMPRWHPPPPEDLDELARRLQHLNENILFSNPNYAIEFRNYYKSKDWAETEDEPDAFSVIKVGLLDL